MSSPCYVHPAAPAVGTCVQCGTPGCAACIQQVAGKSVCQRCVGAIRARLAQQEAQSGPAPGAAAAVNATKAARPDAGIGPQHVLIGVLLGGVIGVVGAILIEKVLFYAHFGLSLLYVALGYGIGWGIHRVTGRGGPGLAFVAVLVMLSCLGVSHLVMAQDMLNAARASGDAAPGVTALDVLPAMAGHMGIMHWVCIALGLGACYRGVEQQEG